MKDDITRQLVSRIRSGEDFTRSEELSLVVRLAIPAIFAQIATVLMTCIDATMVGNLGAREAAAVGIVTSSTWLFWGLGSAFIAGYPVLASHRIGAKDYEGARALLRQGLTATGITGLVLALVGILISGPLPGLLGAAAEVIPEATIYFAIYTAALPILFVSYFAGSMLRSTGNIRIPALLNILMCVEDVIFNALLIFPTRTLEFLGLSITLPGAGLGVAGAALGTVLAEICTALPMLWFACVKSPELSLKNRPGRFWPEALHFKRAVKIGIPIGCQHIAMCTAQVVSTMIVAPLGTFAVAAHSLAITAEGLCYMPGLGIAEAATSLTGQCIGAKRKNLAWRFAKLSIGSGVAVMTVMGVLLWFAAPAMMAVMSQVPEIIELGASVLRIEAFAEPVYAAAIVTYGVFVGAGDTLAPCLMNLGSMWLARLPAAFFLSHVYGLKGVWLAMCGELIFRGAIFLVRFKSGRWLEKKA